MDHLHCSRQSHWRKPSGEYLEEAPEKALTIRTGSATWTNEQKLVHSVIKEAQRNGKFIPISGLMNRYQFIRNQTESCGRQYESGDFAESPRGVDQIEHHQDLQADQCKSRREGIELMIVSYDVHVHSCWIKSTWRSYWWCLVQCQSGLRYCSCSSYLSSPVEADPWSRKLLELGESMSWQPDIPKNQRQRWRSWQSADICLRQSTSTFPTHATEFHQRQTTDYRPAIRQERNGVYASIGARRESRNYQTNVDGSFRWRRRWTWT